MADDYYELLGVQRNASDEEIKKAYRKVARQLHPDVSDAPDAEERFKAVSRAHEVLSDPQRRARYDQFGSDDERASMGGDPFGGAGLGDIFESFFGGRSPFGGGATRPSGPPRGPDIEATLALDFEEAVFGVHKPVQVRTAVTCSDCSGSGAQKGTGVERCGDCSGTGQVQRVRQSILGQMVTASACERCGATGEIVSSPCGGCSGEGRSVEEVEYPVDVPGGVDHGTTLRLTGRGAVGPRGGQPGDLYVHIDVQPHAHLVRDGVHLVHQMTIPITQAAFGATVPYETLDGAEELQIAKGTQTGDEITFRGLGVPDVRGRGRRGDLVVQFIVETPTNLSKEEERLLREFAAVRGDSIAEPSGLKGRLRSALS